MLNHRGELLMEILGPATETKGMFLKAGVHRVPSSDVAGDHKHIQHIGTPMSQGLNCINDYSVALN